MRRLLIVFLFILPIGLYAGSPIIRNIDGGVELRNNHVSIILSDSASLKSCTELSTGINFAANDKKKIAQYKDADGNIIEADSLVLEGNVLSLFFDKSHVDLELRAYDVFFTAEVIFCSISNLASLTFIDLRLKYDINTSESFIAASVAMSLQTDPVYYPTGKNKEVIGRCMYRTGIEGAKLAIVACQKKFMRDALKKVYTTEPLPSVPFSLIGGPFSVDSEINKMDCLILTDSDPSLVPGWIRFYSQWGINQFDFHQGSSTFIQGDFTFPKTGSAHSFKQLVANPLSDAGIMSILHTYSYYISYNATELLSDPKWQQQLEFRERFSLAKSISASSTSIEVTGDTSALNNNFGFTSIRSPYILIDNEIIKYTISNSGFVSCQRGQCGTKAEPHKVGAQVMIIGGYYGCIAPQPGSELFYEIAQRTARAYNEGGFKGIYFDAIDGLSVHLKNAGQSEYLWYYYASFVYEVLKNCKDSPLVEYSTLSPSLWPARGRAGACDTPNRAFKNWIDDHLRMNKTYMDYHYVTTLGWYDFYPQRTTQPGNFSTKYMFFDDVDYLGVASIIYNQPMIYQQLQEKTVNSVPALERNLKLYKQYNQLRKSGYFNDRIKSILRESNHEFKLYRKNGQWGFKEAYYCRVKMHDISLERFSGFNPFKSQAPFIRLENQYSSSGENPIPLLQFDETQSLTSQECKKVFLSSVDLSGHLGVRLRIKGAGEDAISTAVCIRLCSPGSTSGYADYVALLDFDGWRDIYLTSLDNGEYPDLSFKGMEDEIYKTHRFNLDYNHVSSVQLFFAGNADSVRVKTIDAVPLISNDLFCPLIEVDNATLEFKDTLHSGEYLEYNVDDRQAIIYDRIGTPRYVKVERKGRLRLPEGYYRAIVSGIPEADNASSQVVLTFGTYGSFIRN